jgi:choline-sulfatase
VPLIISNPWLFPEPASVHSVTSHVDSLPTILGLAGLDPRRLRKEVAVGHSDPQKLVGRNLKKLVFGKVTALTDPIYLMTDDDPSRGLDQENVFGVTYDWVVQPNHIETVIIEIDGEVWKYSRYLDNPQFWSDPDPLVGPVKDIVVTAD